MLPLLEASFGGWKPPAAARVARHAAGAAAAARARAVYLVDKPGAPQSQIRIGWRRRAALDAGLLPAPGDEHVLGGSFSSRLNLNLREKHGYTYGAQLGLRHARSRRAVLRRCRRADRQDSRSR